VSIAQPGKAKRHVLGAYPLAGQEAKKPREKTEEKAAAKRSHE